MKVISLRHLGCSLHFTFDYNEFDKVFELEEDHRKSAGIQCGNGIWINPSLKEEEIKKTIVHELCHYLDWLWEAEFKIKNSYDSTEIRARLQQELYVDLIEIYNKYKKMKK